MSDAAHLPDALVGQPRAARTLAAAMRNRSAHAFLISAAAGMDAHEVAVWIAQQVLCPNGGDGTCNTCTRVARRVHPDLIWEQPEGSFLRSIEIERALEQVVRRPFEAAAQVVVFASAHSLADTNAINANRLLKVLEEPPGDVVFVLLSENSGAILPTIRSRVLEVTLPPLTDGAAMQLVAAQQIVTGLAPDALVRIARGNPQRLRELAAGGDAWQRHRIALEVCEALATASSDTAALAERIAARAFEAGEAERERAEAAFARERETMSDKDAKRMETTKDSEGHTARAQRRAREARSADLLATLDDIAQWYRDLLATAAGAPGTVSNVDAADVFARLARSPVAQTAALALDVLDDAPQRIRTNVDEQSMLAALCAELAGLAAGRIRARRSYGASARTPQGLEVHV